MVRNGVNFIAIVSGLGLRVKPGLSSESDSKFLRLRSVPIDMSFILKFWSLLGFSLRRLQCVSLVVPAVEFGTLEDVTKSCLTSGDMLPAPRVPSSFRATLTVASHELRWTRGGNTTSIGPGHLEEDIELPRERTNHCESEKIQENARREER